MRNADFGSASQDLQLCWDLDFIREDLSDPHGRKTNRKIKPQKAGFEVLWDGMIRGHPGTLAARTDRLRILTRGLASSTCPLPVSREYRHEAPNHSRRTRQWLVERHSKFSENMSQGSCVKLRITQANTSFPGSPFSQLTDTTSLRCFFYRSTEHRIFFFCQATRNSAAVPRRCSKRS